MKKLFKWKNYLIVYAVLLLLVNLLLIKLPLTKVFGYEFSAVNAIVISFFTGIFTITYLSTEPKNTHSTLFSPIIQSSALLLIPFIVSILNSLLTGFCSFWDGILFYLVITVPSVVIGSALGIVSFSAVSKFRPLVFLLLFVFILLVPPFFEIYYYPQVYLYNPIFGYFPGTIYDEGLSVDFKLFFYRFFNSVFFLGIFVVLRYSLRAKTRTVILRRLVYSLITAALFYFLISPSLGYTTTFSKIKNILNVKIETEHFLIYADNGIDKNVLKYIAVSQEYFYKKHSDFLNEEFDDKINSFIFYSAQQKKELFGSGNADVAKPWQECVYVSLSSWESSLEHEIAHCFAGKFGWSIFRVASDFNPALIEGVAEACDGFYDELDIHFLASIARKNDYQRNISNLFSGFNFFGNVSGLSYVYSGSFVKFLIEEFGINKLKRYYRTNNFSSSFGKDIYEVEKEYEKFLDSFTAEEWNSRADYYFGRQSILQKVCPRFISDRLETAWRLLGEKKYNEAKIYFNETLARSENYSALVGLSIVLEETDSLSSAIKILKSDLKTFKNTSYEFNLMFRTADLLIKAKKLTEAESIFESLSKRRPNLRLELLSLLRLSLIKESRISEYVSGSEFDKYFLLKEINSNKYHYFSIPAMITLSERLDENYDLFLSNFKDNIEVSDFFSSYASLKLSQYMLKNFDYLNARKMAGLAIRYKDDDSMSEFKEENYIKSKWFYKNADEILNALKFSY